MQLKLVKWVLTKRIFLALTCSTALFFEIPAGSYGNSATKYLLFQVFTYPTGPDPARAQVFPGPRESKKEISAFVDRIIASIGSTGSSGRKLGFAVGPLTFDNSDEEIRELINASFQIALEKDVAVCLHLDDSMFWGARSELRSNPANVEWIDWQGTPSTGRRIEWGPTPTKIAPQMCLNSPSIKAEVHKRSILIGQLVSGWLVRLNKAGKSHLFAGLIAGWETQMGRDMESDQSTGYHALVNKGFSSSKPPGDKDRERVQIVKEFIEQWCSELAQAGVPSDKIYCHLGLFPEPLLPADRRQKYKELNNFATLDTAFSSKYRPGFSTYPLPGLVEVFQQETARRRANGWASCEGTNVIPDGNAGEANMESYLAKLFNHGASLVDIFGWGVGPDPKNIFRQASEGAGSIQAYRKFLKGEKLVEAAATNRKIPSAALPNKIHSIQAKAPAWAQKTGRITELQPLMIKLDQNIKANRWDEANEVADKILKLIGD